MEHHQFVGFILHSIQLLWLKELWFLNTEADGLNVLVCIKGTT
jgi:hypothetical protein